MHTRNPCSMCSRTARTRSRPPFPSAFFKFALRLRLFLCFGASTLVAIFAQLLLLSSLSCTTGGSSSLGVYHSMHCSKRRRQRASKQASRQAKKKTLHTQMQRNAVWRAVNGKKRLFRYPNTHTHTHEVTTKRHVCVCVCSEGKQIEGKKT